jgi:hypothetical protein
MIKSEVYNNVGTAPGEPLPAFAWPGGYQIVYFTEDGETACPECANGGNGGRFAEPEDPGDYTDPQWTLIGADVYWEGPDLFCCHCNAAIPSAYGDPDEPTV